MPSARMAVRASRGPDQIGVKISFKDLGVTALSDKAVNGGPRDDDNLGDGRL